MSAEGTVPCPASLFWAGIAPVKVLHQCFLEGRGKDGRGQLKLWSPAPGKRDTEMWVSWKFPDCCPYCSFCAGLSVGNLHKNPSLQIFKETLLCPSWRALGRSPAFANPPSFLPQTVISTATPPVPLEFQIKHAYLFSGWRFLLHFGFRNPSVWVAADNHFSCVCRAWNGFSHSKSQAQHRSFVEVYPSSDKSSSSREILEA